MSVPGNGAQFPRRGERVEVLKRRRGSPTTTTTTLAYYSATVVSSPSTHRVTVQYGGDGEREVVDRAEVRPLPPRATNELFKVGDNVEAEAAGGWRVGKVKDIMENSRYLVHLNDNPLAHGEELVVDHFNLRTHRKWVRGAWVPPLPHPRSSLDSSSGEFGDLQETTQFISDASHKNVRLKIKYRKRKSEPLFREGAMVEVRSDEEGYQGAWFAAMIVGSIGIQNEKFLVQYVTLMSDDEISPLQEVALAQDIRPFPPRVMFFEFELHDKVDAWYNEGWWEGVVSKVITGSKCIVYFCHTLENLEFDCSNLRPRQDWINGKWITGKPSTFEIDPRIPREKFRKGTKVEVRSDDVGLQGAWFVATVTEVKGKDMFLIQYESHPTDDITRPLREEASISHLRPCPPYVQRVYPFRLLEAVNAWYKNGWWVGQIIKVEKGFKYIVHFETLGDLQFEHCELRSHQEWIGGNWINVSEGWKYDPLIPGSVWRGGAPQG